MRFVSGKSWGGARLNADGKLKVYRKPKDVAQRIQWRKSKKISVVSRKKASRFNQP